MRSRLLEQVGRRFEVPITVIVAGAGFGKSTLLAQAIRANQADPRGIDAWVSCEPGDGDAWRLAAAIVASLGQNGGRHEPIDSVLEAAAQLAPIDVCLVVDDVHEVPPGTSGAELLATLATRLPPHVHLAFAGRDGPPVPLARRRAMGDVVDIGMDALVFTPTETAALARALGRDDATGAGIGTLAGWPSLVRLALSAPTGSAPQFLWEEVVARLSLGERQALLGLATLGWGTAADVATVAGSDDVDLDAVVDRVPLISCDDEGWYRAHDLWEQAVDRIFAADVRREPRRRALELFRRRSETLRAGWSALRWGDGEALRLACRELVRDTLGALPIDTSERWLAGATDVIRETTDMRLLGLAVRHARRFDAPHLDTDIDAVVDEFFAAGDHDGASVALSFATMSAHMSGASSRLVAIAERVRLLPDAAEAPMLRLLDGLVEAASASLRGDPARAVAVIEAKAPDGVTAAVMEMITRLHVNMLCLCGRADEAVAVAEVLGDSASAYVRTLPGKVRWLAGDPSAFPQGRFELDPGPETNARYRFFHAASGTAVAASFGDVDTLEALRPIIERAAATPLDDRDHAMVASATALRHVAEHDEQAASNVIADHITAHPEADRAADVRLRRNLAVAYVCDERVRGRWCHLDLGPSQRRQRAIADDLLAARSATLSVQHRFAPAPSVLTALALPWSVELASRAVSAGCTDGQRLAAGLAELAPEAVRRELEHAAESGDEAVRHGARWLLDALARPTTPVRVGVLGPLELTVGEHQVPATPELRRSRVRTLLALVVLAGPLRRRRIADLMWPELDPATAGRNLRVTLSRLRAVLQPEERSERRPTALQIVNDVVALAPHVEVDLWQFGADVAAADAAERRGDSTATMAALERACNGWRGEPFAGIVLPGELAGELEHVRRRLTGAALRLGELALVAGRFDGALAMADRVTQDSPYDERAHRLAIAAQLQRRDRDGIARAVAATTEMLTELDVEPEPATRMLLRQAAARLGRVAGSDASSRRQPSGNGRRS